MPKALVFVAAALVIPPAFAAPGPGNDDYPLDALNKHEQGVVLTDLTIGTDGRVSDCKVLVSPGSPTLDAATCSAFLTRARFDPERDNRGNPKQSHARAKITWVIPGCRAPAQRDPRLADSTAVQGVITSLQHC